MSVCDYPEEKSAVCPPAIRNSKSCYIFQMYVTASLLLNEARCGLAGGGPGMYLTVCVCVCTYIYTRE